MNKMDTANEALQMAQGISEYGIMIIICAVFLLLSTGLMIACFKWFKKSLDDLLKFTSEIGNLNNQLQENNRVMERIAEGLIPETQLRIKNMSSAFFDLAVEKVCRIIKKVRSENHIADREATADKIRTLLTNIHEDRNSRFDSFKYKGKTLSEYTNSEWIEWVSDVVEGELYNEAGENNGRAYTNVKAVYDNIKLDFYHRLNA